MSVQNIKFSGFSLVKYKELKGDDYYDVKSIGNLTVAIVCDGVGSATQGAQAASRVTNYLMNNIQTRPKAWSLQKSILTFIKSINSILYRESQINYESSELVTTLTIVVIEGNRLYGANVGDSRVYMHRDNLVQLSHDHSMDETGYENVLTQAIGIEEDVSPFYFENILKKDDKILLCSDGLYSVLSDTKLEDAIPLGAHSLVKRASTLMEDNLPDDTTAVVLHILNADELEELKLQSLPIVKNLKAGAIIDGYHLDKPLIQNERTWLVSKKTKQYVLKFPPVEAIDNETLLDLFVREAWNAKRLKNSILPKAVIPKNRTKRYYLMQLFEGEDLHTYLKHKKLTIDDSIHLAQTLVIMSQYLLKYDLVHGDIKPQNIIVSKDKNENITFKVIDFGNMQEIFSSDSTAGTPSFLSPERYLNDAINESSEIFAIGVTLYLALTGKYPYGEIEPFQNPKFKEAKPPSIYNNNIPGWLESLILRSITIDKKIRYEHYSQINYLLEHPAKVKPYFVKNTPLIEKSPHIFYKRAFTLMTLVNFMLIYFLLK